MSVLRILGSLVLGAIAVVAWLGAVFSLSSWRHTPSSAKPGMRVYDGGQLLARVLGVAPQPRPEPRVEWGCVITGLVLLLLGGALAVGAWFMWP
jgi:hypothetical protein